MILFIAGAVLGGLLGFFGMASLAVAARADAVRTEPERQTVGAGR